MARLTTQELEAIKNNLASLTNQAKTLVAQLESHQETHSKLTQNLNTSITESDNTLEEIIKTFNSAEEKLLDIEKIHSRAIEDYQPIKSLSDEVLSTQKKLQASTLQIEKLTKTANELKDTIENLLPGATSAGLASAFQDRKEKFATPKFAWACIFIISIIILIIIAITGNSQNASTLEYKEVFLQIVRELPFIIPIAWLAVYAGRRHSQALRLEEDYAHKEVISKSFEGYKKQLLEIAGEDSQATKDLIDRTLQALSLHPDRIYEGRHEDIHPLSFIMNRKSTPPDS